MPFVNEYISTEDEQTYQLKALDTVVTFSLNSNTWTIDRDQEIYLRIQGRGREDRRHISDWTLYWKGSLIPIQLHSSSKEPRCVQHARCIEGTGCTARHTRKWRRYCFVQREFRNGRVFGRHRQRNDFQWRGHRVIDQTEAAKFFTSREFLSATADAHGISLRDMQQADSFTLHLTGWAFHFAFEAAL